MAGNFYSLYNNPPRSVARSPGVLKTAPAPAPRKIDRPIWQPATIKNYGVTGLVEEPKEQKKRRLGRDWVFAGDEGQAQSGGI